MPLFLQAYYCKYRRIFCLNFEISKRHILEILLDFLTVLFRVGNFVSEIFCRVQKFTWSTEKILIKILTINKDFFAHLKKTFEMKWAKSKNITFQEFFYLYNIYYLNQMSLYYLKTTGFRKKNFQSMIFL